VAFSDEGTGDTFFLEGPNLRLADVWLVLRTELSRLLLPFLAILTLFGMAYLGAWYARAGTVAAKVAAVLLSPKVCVPLGGVLPAVWLGLTIYELVELWLDRSRRYVRLDIDEIEMWREGKRQFIPLRDVLAVRLTQPHGRFYRFVFRPDQGLQIFRKERSGPGVEKITVNWAPYRPVVSAYSTDENPDGNRSGLGQIVELWRRRVARGIPVAEGPQLEIELTSTRGDVFRCDGQAIAYKRGDRTTNVARWAILSQKVGFWSRGGGLFARGITLELDPSCGEDRLEIDLSAFPDPERILFCCEYLGSRLDRESASPRARPPRVTGKQTYPAGALPIRPV
jgi:hypothetical protein